MEAHGEADIATDADIRSPNSFMEKVALIPCGKEARLITQCPPQVALIRRHD
jgi:hypothetical protein